jgi:hypothetical protein
VLGWLEGTTRNDFQHNGIICILNKKEQMAVPRGMVVFDNNLIDCSIGFSIRHCMEHTWTNDRDQFLHPNDGYKKDKPFQTDCLIYTLFHHQNRIRCKDGVNHWIPFSAREVNAKDNFKSSFMSDLLKNRRLSKEAKAVFETGKALWTYYHEKTRKLRTAPVNASLYEIREFFKGRDETGRMKTKSDDKEFNVLDAKLRSALKKLAEKIQPKVYEYAFLK